MKKLPLLPVIHHQKVVPQVVIHHRNNPNRQIFRKGKVVDSIGSNLSKGR